MATHLAAGFVRPLRGDPSRLALGKLGQASHLVTQLGVRHDLANHADVAARLSATRVVALRGEVGNAVASEPTLVFAAFKPALVNFTPLCVRLSCLCEHSSWFEWSDQVGLCPKSSASVARPVGVVNIVPMFSCPVLIASWHAGDPPTLLSATAYADATISELHDKQLVSNQNS